MLRVPADANESVSEGRKWTSTLRSFSDAPSPSNKTSSVTSITFASVLKTFTSDLLDSVYFYISFH